MRGDLRPRDRRSRTTASSSIRGDRDDPFSHGSHLPQGGGAQGHPRRPGPARRRRCAGPGGQLGGDRLGRGASTRPPSGWRPSSRPTAGTPSPSTWATRPCTTWGTCSTARRCCELCRHQEHATPRPRSTSCRTMLAALSDVRPPAAAADPRHRSHRLPAHARRQPGGVERQPDDRARRSRGGSRRSTSAAASWWWSTRAAPRPPRLADRHPFIRPGTDALLLLALLHTLFSEGLAEPGRLAAIAGRCGSMAAGARGRLPPERVGGTDRDRRPTTSAPWLATSPPRRRAVLLRPARASRRRSSAGSASGWSTCSTSSPATSTVPAARCSPGPAVDLAAHRPVPGSLGRWQSRVRGLPEFGGELPVCRPRRGDRDARRGPDPRPDHGRRATRCCRPPTGAQLERALAGLDFMVSDRSLPQRDHPPRPPDPAADLGARARPLRPRRSTLLAVRNIARYSPPSSTAAAGSPPRLGDLRRSCTAASTRTR